MLETPSKQVARAGTVVCTGCTCARLVLGSFERVGKATCPSRAGEWEEPVVKEGHHPWQGLTTLSRSERHFPGPPDAAGRLRDPEPVLTMRLAGVCGRARRLKGSHVWRSVFERSLLSTWLT